MIADRKLDLAKELLEEDRLKTFGDIFIYVTKTHMAEKLGMNYKRFVWLTNHPDKMKYSETYLIARVLDADPRVISTLIHNELDNHQKTKKAKAKG